jgi:hypothetical protein
MIPVHGVSGHGNDRAMPVALPFTGADGRRGRIPVHLGHLAVHEHDIIGSVCHGLHRFEAIGRHIDPAPKFF